MDSRCFLQRLYDLLGAGDDSIRWSDDGSAFEVLDADRFEATAMKEHFTFKVYAREHGFVLGEAGKRFTSPFFYKDMDIALLTSGRAARSGPVKSASMKRPANITLHKLQTIHRVSEQLSSELESVCRSLDTVANQLRAYRGEPAKRAKCADSEGFPFGSLSRVELEDMWDDMHFDPLTPSW